MSLLPLYEADVHVIQVEQVYRDEVNRKLAELEKKLREVRNVSYSSSNSSDHATDRNDTGHLHGDGVSSAEGKDKGDSQSRGRDSPNQHQQDHQERINISGRTGIDIHNLDVGLS